MTTPAEVERIVARLSASARRNLFALPKSAGVWLTVAEMRPAATGSGMDVLCCMRRLCDRRWTKWGSDRRAGVRGGEGYEYSINERGLAVRQHLLASIESREGKDG